MMNHSNDSNASIFSFLSSANLSFGPAGEDKRPTISSWKILQTIPPSIEQYSKAQWINSPASFIICGAVSQNLEVIDFDEKYSRGITKRWRALLAVNNPEISLKSFPVVKTKSGGYHLYYRIQSSLGVIVDPSINAKMQGNLKLSKTDIGETTIETRGEGGYVISPFSPGYTLIQGTLSSIPIITLEQRNILLNTARALNEYHLENKITNDGFPEPDPNRITKTLAGIDKLGKRPGDVFEREASWQDILSSFGWHSFRPTSKGFVATRPKKEHGVSGEVRAYGDHEVFIVYSSNALPFQSENYYTKFGAYALLKHGGDFKETTRELGAYLLRNPS
jgi:hypothetical protein